MKYDFNAFDVLAGSTHWHDMRETVAQLIGCARTIGAPGVNDWRVESEAPGFFDDGEAADDLAGEIIDVLNENATLPPYCSIDWRDGEVLVLPFVDDDAPRIVDGAPSFLAVNDHGNIACYTWHDDAYHKVWDMV